MGSSQSQSQEKEKIEYMESSQSQSHMHPQKEKEKIAYMADDGAEVEKKNLSGYSKTPKTGGGGIVLALQKKPDLPSKIPKPKSKKVPADLGGRCIVLALGVLNREGNVKKKKKKRTFKNLNEKGEVGSDDLPQDVKEGSDDLLPEDVKEGSDDLPEDVMEGAVMNHGYKPRRSMRTIKPNSKYLHHKIVKAVNQGNCLKTCEFGWSMDSKQSKLHASSKINKYQPSESSMSSQTTRTCSYKRMMSANIQNTRTDVPKKEILQRIKSKKEASSYQLENQLSLKWSTGAGPRIGCVADYPLKLREQALTFVYHSPSDDLHKPSASELPGCLLSIRDLCTMM